MSQENAVARTRNKSASGFSPTWVYVLYLIALFTAVPMLIGLILAYVMKDKAEEPEASHYRFQIRTFWIGLLLIIVGALTFVQIGWLICIFAWVWALMRSVKGMQWYNRYEAVPHPKTWFW